jgi:transcriptional regulator with XRE-family HTH domain
MEDKLSEQLGREVRGLRTGHSMTLEELAEKSNLSVGFLSQVERGMKRPSLKALQAISVALGVEVGWFLQGHPSDDELERAHVVRRAFRRRISYTRLSGTEYLGEEEFLLSPALDGDLVMTVTNFAPGGNSGDDPFTHEGEEVGYVLAGKLTLEVDGTKMELEAGDSFALKGSTPHRYCNDGSEELQVLIVNTPVIMLNR